MTWYAVYETTTGRLVSIGDQVADPLPDGLIAAELASAPDLRSVMWDNVARAFTNRPAPVLVDRLDDLRAMPGVTALWNSLNGTQKTVLANALIALLGGARYRKSGQPVAVREVES